MVCKGQEPYFQKPQKRLRMFKLVAAIVITMDAVKRILSEFRPADWAILFVDLLVLIVIVMDFVHHLRRERKEDRRQKLINERVLVIREAISRGQELQHSSVPVGDSGVDAWYQSVKKWTEQTRSLLASYSPQAEASFMDFSQMVPATTFGSVGAPFDYVRLLAQLSNLRGIIERPSIYLG